MNDARRIATDAERAKWAADIWTCRHHDEQIVNCDSIACLKYEGCHPWNAEELIVLLDTVDELKDVLRKIEATTQPTDFAWEIAIRALARLRGNGGENGHEDGN